MHVIYLSWFKYYFEPFLFQYNFIAELFWSSKEMIGTDLCSVELRGAAAEWSKALLLREKINENQKITGSPPTPGLGNL